MKRLIINADDFGLTEEVNSGIIEAHRNGVITSTSLIANMPAFDDAVRLAKENPALAVGIHLNIFSGKPLLPPESVPTIIDNEGNFIRKPFTLVKKILLRQINLQEIEKELRAQIEHILNTRLEITHLDSHKHFHCYPPLFKIVIKLAVEYGIKRMRYINEKITIFSNSNITEKFYRTFINPRYYHINLLNYCCRMASSELKKNDILHPDYSFGILYSGSMDIDIYGSILRSLKEGTTEIMSHPGYNSNKLKTLSFLTSSREEELRILINPTIKKIITERDIELVTYRSLN